MTSKCPGSTQTETPAEEKRVPLVLHRWFASGEGWAYHSTIDAKDLDRVRTFATSILANRRDCEVKSEKEDKDTLVYRHYADRNCPDPKAQGRFPTVLIVALARGLSESEIAKLEEELRRLSDSDLPTQPGPCPSLQLTVKPEPSCDEKPQGVAGATPAGSQQSRPDLWPKFIAWGGSVLILLAAVILICIEPFSRNFTNISENDGPGPTGTPSGNGREHSAASAPDPKSSAPTTTSASSAQHPGKPNGNRGPNTPPKDERSQPRPPQWKWKIDAAERMFTHLERWKKHKPLSQQLRIPSPSPDIAELWNADLEKVSPGRTPFSIQSPIWTKTTTGHQEDLVIGRFFLVLSQKPVQHLLSEDVRTQTWQGKFILLFPEKPAYTSAGNHSWHPQSEEELRKWLECLENHMAKRQPGPEKPELPKVSAHRITVMVDRVALRIDYQAWKEAVIPKLGLGGQYKYRDCSDAVLESWVDYFRLCNQSLHSSKHEGWAQ